MEAVIHLRSQSARPWLCAGDFNEILDQSEKLGGPPRPVWQLRNFRQALAECELSDLGFSGNPFTWSNHHAFPHTVQERLDRACANLGWSQLFPNASVTHLPVTSSDHVALLVRLVDRPVLANTGFRPWRFEAAWLQSEKCEQVVLASWTPSVRTNVAESMFANFEVCRQNLSQWSRQCFQHDKQRVSKLEKRLATILSGTLTQDLKEEASSIRKELESTAAYAETVWRQQSKALVT
ncbi:UNVERIFIED_CONTAM: hypothetical protein Sangu_0828500 [Sesamum angustifolium]|uniref:Endonuclease/exonuclease/phosphatase domain-containing protein n=1 Tax=Sesamum angustifolium TaxID=2727405 RepID=A0AAW2PWC0_9LAMI